MHNAMRVREGTVTITGSHPHSRWSFCAQGHSILSQYQASYPAILDIATSLSLNKLLGFFPGMATPHLFGMRLNDISFQSLEVSCVRTQHPVEV